MNQNNYPVEVATNLDDLMRFEFMVQTGNILPNHPIYSILAGVHAAKMRGRGLDFEEVRMYVPGDDVRNIDWKVTARTNETYSKVFNEEKERPTFIVLDQSAGMFFGSRCYVKSVVAAQIASLTAFYTIKRGDRFGGLIFNEDNYDVVSPKRSKSWVQHFLQLAVNRNRKLPERKLLKTDDALVANMLLLAQQSITHDFVVAVIGDILTLNNESKNHLRNMSFHNDVIFVHIEDPMDRFLPPGKLIISDGDRQIQWNSSKENGNDKYTNDYDRKLAMVTDEFRRYRIPVSVIDTVTPVEVQVKERIGRKLKR